MPPSYSMSQPQRALSKRVHREVRFGAYVLGLTLGEGEFGKVKLGWRKDGRHPSQVAIKLIKRDLISRHLEYEVKIHREINSLRMLAHPNIVHLVEVLKSGKYIGIVLEYASGGELFDYILQHKYLKEPVAKRLFAQLVLGVDYMHAKGLVHRDLKLENLLLDKHKNVVISDFGFVNSFGRKGDLMKTLCGLPCYAAPELVLTQHPYHGRKVDVWLLGVILYAMLAGYLPFDDDADNEDGADIVKLYHYIQKTPLTFPEYVLPLARDLLRRIIVVDPAQRIGLAEMAAHPWLAAHAPLLALRQPDWDRAELAPKKRYSMFEGVGAAPGKGSATASSSLASAVADEPKPRFAHRHAKAVSVLVPLKDRGEPISRTTTYTGTITPIAESPVADHPRDAIDDAPPKLPHKRPRPTSYHPGSMTSTLMLSSSSVLLDLRRGPHYLSVLPSKLAADYEPDRATVSRRDLVVTPINVNGVLDSEKRNSVLSYLEDKMEALDLELSPKKTPQLDQLPFRETRPLEPAEGAPQPQEAKPEVKHEVMPQDLEPQKPDAKPTQDAKPRAAAPPLKEARERDERDKENREKDKRKKNRYSLLSFYSNYDWSGSVDGRLERDKKKVLEPSNHDHKEPLAAVPFTNAKEASAARRVMNFFKRRSVRIG